MILWMSLWKVVLIGGLSAFFIVAVVVTIFGFLDIKKLFATLNEEHKNQEN